MSMWKRAGIAAVAATVLVGVVGCQDTDKGDKKATGAPELQTRDAVTKVVQAAYKKTAEAKTAKVRMTVVMSGSADAAGTMEMSGVMGWDPTLMDMTMKMPTGVAGAGADADMPEQIRMKWLGEAMYMDLGTKAAKEMDGKRWMKMDFAELAESAEKQGGADASGLSGAMTENMNQNPAESLAILLESPNIQHVGAEKVNGLETEHYKGTVPVAEMIDSNKAFDHLTKAEREKLATTIETAGVSTYEIEVWVTEDDLPARMDVVMDSSLGEMEVRMDLSEFGTKAKVTPPPADETFDLAEMMAGAGA
jgi:hypothetical protein